MKVWENWLSLFLRRLCRHAHTFGRLVPGRFSQRSGLRDVRVVRHLQARMMLTVAQKSIGEFGKF